MDRDDKGRFVPGSAAAGRPKKSKNKISKSLRERLTAAANRFELIDRLFDDLEKLSPLDRVKATIALMPYLIPKMQTIEFREATTLEDFILLSPEERKRLIADIRHSHGNGKSN